MNDIDKNLGQRPENQAFSGQDQRALGEQASIGQPGAPQAEQPRLQQLQASAQPAAQQASSVVQQVPAGASMPAMQAQQVQQLGQLQAQVQQQAQQSVQLQPQSQVQQQTQAQQQPQAQVQPQAQLQPQQQAQVQQQVPARVQAGWTGQQPNAGHQATGNTSGSAWHAQAPAQAAQTPTSAQAAAAAQAPTQPQPQPQAAQAYQQRPFAQPQPQAFAPQPGAYAPAGYAAVQQAAPAKKKSYGWIVAIVLIVCLTAFTAFCVKSCTDAVSSLGVSGGSAPISGDTIAKISIDGTIQYDGSACSPEGFKELLEQAESNDSIKAVVLRVNSGGGTATAGEEMAAYLRDFPKPVVVSSASINASAAYEISAQADYIYVAKSTEIGAIGTAMQLTNLSGLLDMLGVNMEVITSAESKDSSYGYRALTDEERAYYQDMVDKINQMFVENVMEGRHMTEEQVKALATGMPFTGSDAVENGLADAVGTCEDAYDKAAELAGISDYDTTELYFSDYSLSGLSYLLGESRVSLDDLASLLKEVGGSAHVK